MASVIISGDTSGSVALQAPAVAGSTTLTLPATNGTLITTATGQTLTSPNISGAVMSTMASSVLTSGTAQATTSGTAVTISGIPSWAKRITVMLNSVTTGTPASATYNLTVGNSTSYTGSLINMTGSNTRSAWSSSVAITPVQAGATTQSGNIVITLENAATFTYTVSGQISTQGANNTNLTGGIVVCSANISSVTLNTTSGGNFSAGDFNILYE